MAAPTGRTSPNGYPYPTSNDDVNTPRDIQALADAVEAKGLIVGEVRHIAALSLPPGWVPCDGAAKSRTAFVKLFNAIGTLFGTGDGSTTFNVPDVQGRSIVGSGAGAGLTARAVGTKWGVEAVVLSKAQIPLHNHGGASGNVDLTHLHTKPFEPGLGYVNAVSSAAELILASGSALAVRFSSAVTGGPDRSLLHGHPIANDGGDGGHENAPPSITIPAFIYAGV
jgi:microcystin-dependent protein